MFSRKIAKNFQQISGKFEPKLPIHFPNPNCRYALLLGAKEEQTKKTQQLKLKMHEGMSSHR